MSSTETQDDTGLYIAYGALMTMAVVPIYHGSIASLSGMKRPANAKKRQKTDSPLEDSDDEDETVSESLSSSDAWWFPVMGSAVLFSLYLVFRFVDKEYINYLMTIYFSFIGCLAVAKTGLMFTKKIVPPSLVKGRIEKYRLTLSKQGKHLSHVSFTIIHFFLLALSMVLTAYYTLTKNWVASNVFGFSFSVNAIQLLSLDSFKTGIILLSGLFLYDIFWVFGTEVMVTVAKSFDAPIKVVWPRDIVSYLFDSSIKEHGFTMLGLGDIVIPGIFVALCLRFDRHMAWNRNPVGEFRSTVFPKPYFTSCLIAYILGLATTMFVMHVFHAAQPALLYLSPACILSSLLTAAARGELKELFAYTTEEEEEEKKDGDKKKGSKKDKDSGSEDEGDHQPAAAAAPDDEDYVAVNDGNNKDESPAAENKTRSRSGKKKK